MNSRAKWMVGAGVGVCVLIALGVRSRRRATHAPDGATNVTVFHGYGADENDLVPLADDVRTFGAPTQFDFTFARGPLSVGSGYGWWNSARDFDEGRAAASAAMGRTPTSLLGFSQGATIALDAALAHPGRFRCVVAISPPRHPMGAWSARVHNPGALRIFLAHGSNDSVVPRASSDELHAALVARHATVEYVRHAGRHEIPTEVRRAIGVFLRQCDSPTVSTPFGVPKAPE